MAVESNASLLVMGANDLTKKRLGSVASHCLRTVPCDVLILRDWQAIAFRKIFVCTDLSATAGRALQRGLSLARLHGAKLDIAYVMFPPSQYVWGAILHTAADDEETYDQRCREAVKSEMDTFIATYAPEIASVDHTVSILESASPGLALKYHAGDTDTDLAVLGSQPHSRLASLFSAATTESLLHDSSASVLAVRDPS